MLVDDFRKSVLKKVAYIAYSHGPGGGPEPYDSWMERQVKEAGNFAREAKPEYLPIILDALTGYPDAEFIEREYTEMDFYLDAIGDILNQWALIEPEFVLSNTIACLRENMLTPHRSTILIAMSNLMHAYLPRYIDPAMMDFEGYTNDDRIWMATAIGNSRGIGAADLLTRFLANTPETMPEACGEVKSYLNLGANEW